MTRTDPASGGADRSVGTHRDHTAAAGADLFGSTCLAALADRALASNGLAECETCRLLVVPDVIVAQAAANGEDLPSTFHMLRHDGRSAHVFRLPEPEAAQR